MFDWLHDWLNRDDLHHAMLRIIEAHLLERPGEWEWSEHTAINAEKRLCILDSQ